jgi:hypothetical protein
MQLLTGRTVRVQRRAIGIMANQRQHASPLPGGFFDGVARGAFCGLPTPWRNALPQSSQIFPIGKILPSWQR